MLVGGKRGVGDGVWSSCMYVSMHTHTYNGYDGVGGVVVVVVLAV